MDDKAWRLQGQGKYLTGVELIRQAWRQSRPQWDHDHCEFCHATFARFDGPDVLHEGWTTPDAYRWICDACFADFRHRFAWVIADGSVE
jgi:hypothetical protein